MENRGFSQVELPVIRSLREIIDKHSRRPSSPSQLNQDLTSTQAAFSGFFLLTILHHSLMYLCTSILCTFNFCTLTVTSPLISLFFYDNLPLNTDSAFYSFLLPLSLSHALLDMFVLISYFPLNLTYPAVEHKGSHILSICFIYIYICLFPT